ncbi:GDSL esterase/lipase EXL3-like [Silene latifolia]|uniref:GDSL esterase/lipase EXL3-like n=1 Tax=Silene latifolia TaxID=37657 RepID=UPI003D7762CA
MQILPVSLPHAESLGIKKHVQAYLDPSLRVQDLVTGVSFASSGSGFDTMTSHLASVRSLDEQLKMFKKYRKTVKSLVGSSKTDFILKNSIFILAAGSWDLANTYFALPFRRVQYDVDSYTTLMLKHASHFLKKLYRSGARKIGVSNVPPLGNIPLARTLAGGIARESAEHYNHAVQMFNTKLNLEVQYLNLRLPQAKLVYIDLYGIMLDILNNKTQYGFEVSDRGCCGSGLIEAGPLCNPFSQICDPKKFVFWDSYHATEAVNKIFAERTLEKHFPLFF